MSKEHKNHDLCRRCSECCRLKVNHGDFIVALEVYCQYFGMCKDGKEGCTLYPNHEGTEIALGMKCIPSWAMLEARILPESCPYAKQKPGYSTRVINY